VRRAPGFVLGRVAVRRAAMVPAPVRGRDLAGALVVLGGFALWTVALSLLAG
jgi:hypothetical protein